jgi:hypothetical protein
VTTAPAPTMEFSPIDRRGKITAPAPIITLSCKVTHPHNVAPGAKCTPSPTTHSWSIDAQWLTMQAWPTRASAATTACAKTCVPVPRLALAHTDASG